MSNLTVAEVEFKVVDDIGAEGKNSDVFKVLDTGLNAEMVLKRIKKSDFNDPLKYFNEARMLFNTSHPNVVEVNYTCQDSDYIYITMPFYCNGSLSKLMSTRHLTLREIIRYSVQCVSGLHNIHSNGLLHFDIKPDNILLSNRGEAMLSDFGLASYMDHYGLSQPDKFYVKHLPPEAIYSQQFSTAWDIYQVGLTIYRMCIGSDAFNAQYAQYGLGANFDRALFKNHLENGIFPDRNALPVHIHSKVKSAILRCIQVDPDDRFDAAIDLVNAISDVKEEFLDWQYSVDSNIRKWEKHLPTGGKKCIEVDSQGKSKAYSVSASNKTRTIKEFTKTGVTDRELKKFLGS